MKLRELIVFVGMLLMSCNLMAQEDSIKNYRENSKIISERFVKIADYYFNLKDYDINEDNIVDIREAYFIGEKEPFIYFF